MVYEKERRNRKSINQVIPNFCFRSGRVEHIERVCKDELVMSYTDEESPMYGPWLRNDRTRKKGHQCQMVGKNRRGGKKETKRTRWREVMREKEHKGGRIGSGK